MDITPIFELRSRLRAAMIAGTNLLSEDFRLKKAAENFSALSGASPVFAKINAMTEKLFSDRSPECLLDTITLVDAVITTFGTAEVKGELEDLPDNGISSVIATAPYSRLSAVTNALSASNKSSYNTILAAHNEMPEIFKDYRLIPAIVKWLGANYIELSACYSELADTTANILKGLGKEIIPLIKNSFDPKGKKDSINLLNVIEDVCGAEENDFYLEQIEDSEKDVRKALIYALRHDESNIDKLIELTKIEKGKSKTAALAALASFDCAKAAEFIEEYAKKKPDDIIKIMYQVSSSWSSGLTARLINELLVDDKGNKVTLSQAADKNKVTLKSKTQFRDLHFALWGKWGADIEKIYREFDFKNSASNPLSTWLGRSIIVTRNESLMDLAIELNNKSNLKGHYDYAETTVRLLGTEDCSEWLKKKTRELNQKSARDPHKLYISGLTDAMKDVRRNNGGYELYTLRYDEISNRYSIFSAPITQPMKQLMDIFIFGNHFVQEFIKKPDIGVLSIIGKAGIKNVKELVDAFFNQNETITQYGIRGFFNILQGDRDFKLKSAQEIIELSRKGELKAKIDVDDFALWVESGMN